MWPKIQHTLEQWPTDYWVSTEQREAGQTWGLVDTETFLPLVLALVAIDALTSNPD